MLNEITVMGRLTADPALNKTSDGHSVANFTLAVQRDDGGKDNTADFIEVTAWRSLADFVSKYFVKGQAAIVSGRLRINSWTDKDGIKHKNAQIVANKVYFAEKKGAAIQSAPTDMEVPFDDAPDAPEIPFN